MSRLYARSKNYDMELTLDYNVELFPLQKDQSFALALASSLSRVPQGAGGAADDEEKDKDVWRPDMKRRGLDDDYDYVMYGKVSVVSLPSARLRSPVFPYAASSTNSSYAGRTVHMRPCCVDCWHSFSPHSPLC